MKSIETSVGVIPTQEKEAEVEKVEEEDIYTEHRNEMYFFLEEHPEYRIYATGGSQAKNTKRDGRKR